MARTPEAYHNAPVRVRSGQEHRKKHGLDFEAVQALWTDTLRVEIPARTLDEPRWALIGRIGSRHWTVIFTRRDDRIRLISARRARIEEVALYEEGFR